MTLSLFGNSFKYELECVIKLFFPNEKITHLNEEFPLEEDFFVAKVKKGTNFSYLFVTVNIFGQKKRKAQKLSNSTENIDAKIEMNLCKILFLILQELTGKEQKWGVLTGVRPVKRVNNMLKKNMSKEEIITSLEEDFFVSRRKSELCYNTALTQENALKGFNEKSYSLYISIPFCPSRCSYCSFISNTTKGNDKLIQLYVENLRREISYTAKVMESLDLTLDTVYFGGGTPTSITALQLESLMAEVANSFDLTKVREYTVEAGRPDTITAEKLAVIKAFGANRISINPQTLNNEVLEKIGRLHSVNQVEEAFNLARNLGFSNINMDLIAGLPFDTVESFSNTMDKIVSLSPENVTLHTLYVKRCADLVSDRAKLQENPAKEMVEIAYEKLEKAGFNPYYLYKQKNTLDNLENTGYSKSGFESLYNIYIMEEIQTIVALGAGASTKLVAKGKNIERVFNYKFPLEYNNHFEVMLQRKGKILDYFKGGNF